MENLPFDIVSANPSTPKPAAEKVANVTNYPFDIAGADGKVTKRSDTVKGNLPGSAKAIVKSLDSVIPKSFKDAWKAEVSYVSGWNAGNYASGAGLLVGAFTESMNALTKHIAEESAEDQRSRRALNLDAITGVKQDQLANVQTFDTMEKLGSKFTYEPKSKGAQRDLKALNFVPEKLVELNEPLGSEVKRLTGSENLSKAAELTATLAEYYLMGKAADGVKAGVRILRRSGVKSSVTEAEVKEAGKPIEEAVAAFKSLAEADPTKARDVVKATKEKNPVLGEVLESHLNGKPRIKLKSSPDQIKPVESKPHIKLTNDPQQHTPWEEKQQGIQATATKLLGGTGKAQGGAINFGAMRGGRADELGKLMAGVGYTSAALERVHSTGDFVPVSKLKEVLRQQDITGPDREIIEDIIAKYGDSDIPNATLAKEYSRRADKYALTPQVTDEYSTYGLKNLGLALTDDKHSAELVDGVSNARTTMFKVPQGVSLTEFNHMKDDGYYAHDRIVTYDEIDHVVESQCDVAQNARRLSPEARTEVEESFKKLTQEQRQLQDALRNHQNGTKRLNADQLLEIKKLYNKAELAIAEGLQKVKRDEIAQAVEQNGLKPGIKGAPIRVVQNRLAIESAEGKSVIRYADPDTMAKGQGWPDLEATVKRQKALISEIKSKGGNVTPEMEDQLAKNEKILSEHGRFGHKSLQAVYDNYKDLVKYLKSIGGELTEPDRFGNRWYEVPVPKDFVTRVFGSHGEKDVAAAMLRNSMSKARSDIAKSMNPDAGLGGRQGGAVSVQDIKDRAKKVFGYLGSSPTYQELNRELADSIHQVMDNLCKNFSFTISGNFFSGR